MEAFDSESVPHSKSSRSSIVEVKKSQSALTLSPLITPFRDVSLRRRRGLTPISRLLEFDSEGKIREIFERDSDQIFLLKRDEDLPTIKEEDNPEDGEHPRVIRRRNRTHIVMNEPVVMESVEPPSVQKIERRGRKRMFGGLEEILAKELEDRYMSRRQIQEFAKAWADKTETQFTASNGWYEKFVNRLKKNHPSVVSNILKTEDAMLLKKKKGVLGKHIKKKPREL